MIEVVAGPLVSRPGVWNLVFERAKGRWRALGTWQHVRAYGYVPFLHVWQFVDVGLRGSDVFVAADGQASDAVIAAWMADADLLSVVARTVRRVPIGGWCVPAMRRLTGIGGGALRPDGFYRDCLRHGATPLEPQQHGRPEVPAATA